MQPSLEIDESDVKINLLQLSKEFREFYSNERPRAGDIKWFFNPHLCKKLAADAVHLYHPNEKYQEIHLSRFPVYLDDAHLVAHEIVHAIFSEEKNVLIIYERKNPRPPLSPYLGSMLEDPIVESLLHEKYNFSLSKDYLRGISILEDEYENHREQMVRLYQIAEAFNLANKIKCWKLIEDREMHQRWDDFLVWYSKPYRCPNIFSISQELVAIIEKFGLETLDQRRRICSEVIEKYQLKKNLSLENKFNADLHLTSDVCTQSRAEESSDAAKKPSTGS